MDDYWVELNKRSSRNLIWSGGKDDSKIHLARWELIARPKDRGGWGLRRIELFSMALRMKSFWRGLFSDTLWHKVLIEKYIKPHRVDQWLRDGQVTRQKQSIVWQGFLDVLPHIKDNLWWQAGSGNLIRLGMDRIVGLPGGGILSDDLLRLFNERGYSLLIHYCTHHMDRSFYWLGTHYFRLAEPTLSEWSSTIGSLHRAGITLDQSEDKMVWYMNKETGIVTVETAYDYLTHHYLNTELWWAHSIWDWRLPHKLVCFFWLVLHNQTLTWDNLRRRGWTGPGICILCSGAEESILHLFFQCRFAKEVWRYICSSLRLFWQLTGHSADDIVHHWFSHFKNHRTLIIFICWGLWRCRNAAIFRNTACSIIHTGVWIMGLYNQYKGNLPDKIPRKRLIDPIDVLLFPTGFFDGAAQGHTGGAGCKLWISQNHSYNLWMGMEHCTNNCAEIIALWLCLYWSKHLGLTEIRIMGDSKVIIDWFNKKAKLHSIILQPWCRAIQLLIPCFTSVTVQHIYRELNGDADTLSKKGIGGLFGTLYFEEILDSTIIRTDHILIFD